MGQFRQCQYVHNVYPLSLVDPMFCHLKIEAVYIAKALITLTFSTVCKDPHPPSFVSATAESRQRYEDSGKFYPRGYRPRRPLDMRVGGHTSRSRHREGERSLPFTANLTTNSQQVTLCDLSICRGAILAFAVDINVLSVNLVHVASNTRVTVDS